MNKTKVVGYKIYYFGLLVAVLIARPASHTVQAEFVEMLQKPDEPDESDKHELLCKVCGHPIDE
jgi:hypothetical protein